MRLEDAASRRLLTQLTCQGPPSAFTRGDGPDYSAPLALIKSNLRGPRGQPHGDVTGGDGGPCRALRGCQAVLERGDLRGEPFDLALGAALSPTPYRSCRLLAGSRRRQIRAARRGRWAHHSASSISATNAAYSVRDCRMMARASPMNGVELVGVHAIGQHGGDVAALAVRHNPIEHRERARHRVVFGHAFPCFTMSRQPESVLARCRVRVGLGQPEPLPLRDRAGRDSASRRDTGRQTSAPAVVRAPRSAAAVVEPRGEWRDVRVDDVDRAHRRSRPHPDAPRAPDAARAPDPDAAP